MEKKHIKQSSISNSDNEYLEHLRHSCAHLLAAAVMELWPGTKRTIGPAIENGFYYDFDFGDNKITTENLPQIESKMHQLVKDWKSFEREEISEASAKQLNQNNEYKLELIEDFVSGKQQLSVYHSGTFTDLCRGGHVEKPSEELKHFKLLSVAGAYWRGNEKNKMLTRIYGTCFSKEAELKSYLNGIEEAKKRDHRKIGKELDLFTFSDLIGSGFPLYTPRGAFIRLSLNNYIESLQAKAGYSQVWTPQVAKADLFKTSGHYDKYKEDMFRIVSNYSEEEFYLKPMNCPQHTQIYASKMRSYKDLPIRMTDFAMLYRDERPGELNGLARVRSFSQDDCHVFCTEDQVDDECDLALSMTKEVMKTFGFKYRYRLSTRDPKNKDKYLGHPETWDKVEAWAIKIMERNKIDYYDGPGEAAFYAPKMDLMATDALGREWQLSTVQIDYVQPERFGLTYTDTTGQQKTPVMIHRAIIGSPERFIMVLLEHFAGALPVWLSPIQVKVLPITDRNLTYSRNLFNEFKSNGIRAELDDRSETLGAKIRDAQNEKVPFMVIIGDKEEKAKSVSVRTREGKDITGMNSQKLSSFVLEKINSRSLELQ